VFFISTSGFASSNIKFATLPRSIVSVVLIHPDISRDFGKRTSGRNYTYLNVHYAFDPDKTFTLTIKQRSNLKLNKDGNSFTENGTFEVIIPNGTIVYAGCFNATSHRLTF